METFGARLHRAMDKRGPLCVGIDPHASLLAQWGLSDDAEGVARFTQTVVDALADRVAVFKPQAAFFERFGSRGVAVLESTIRQLRDAGALVLLDAKRGDIGSTMAAYADAYLNPSSPIYVDAITVSPFLGFGSLRPAFETAAEHGGGVFVLALTSNPEGTQVQHARTADGRTVAQLLLDEIAQLNAGAQPLGSVGAVVGATIGATGHDLSRTNGPFLVPGLGAQGGEPAALREIFGDAIDAVVPSYSREVLAAGPTVSGLVDAAERSLDACRKALRG
ncbi:MAG: orotidine-5'-phosphate decarboxylase [Hamadaea sp.]|nr:orotidine-5'-phosphate decarboxylase [Hamadaea sp.]